MRPKEKQREARFWRMYAQHFTVTDSIAEASLTPKQDILDFFKYWEKWILS